MDERENLLNVYIYFYLMTDLLEFDQVVYGRARSRYYFFSVFLDRIGFIPEFYDKMHPFSFKFFSNQVFVTVIRRKLYIFLI